MAQPPGQINWAPHDSGIDPHGPLFEEDRMDEEISEVPSCLSVALGILCCITSPVSACCACRQVKPMHDTIVTRCGIPTEVWRKPGPRFVNPFCLETDEIYMGLEDRAIKGMLANDSHGSPVVASAQFVYRIADSVSARFRTASLPNFLNLQAESALRVVLSKYPYDTDDDQEECLRKNSDVINDLLKSTLHEMVKHAGVVIESFRLFGITYDPKMEKMLLAPQEAKAEVNARVAIAEGTTGIIEQTLQRLKALGIELSPHERNRLATNLTLLLVNHGHTTINIFDGASYDPSSMLLDKRK